MIKNLIKVSALTQAVRTKEVRRILVEYLDAVKLLRSSYGDSESSTLSEFEINQYVFKELYDIQAYRSRKEYKPILNNAEDLGPLAKYVEKYELFKVITPFFSRHVTPTLVMNTILLERPRNIYREYANIIKEIKRYNDRVFNAVNDYFFRNRMF